jgi:CubicO group peptidase (beta-lactamase class C family)
VNADTVFDLASVTKVVAATAACMLLYDRGLFKLDQPIVEILPEFAVAADPRRCQITFRMLLAHSSGLPAYVKLFQTASAPAELMKHAMAVPLTADPGARAEYSDIGFILLGQALERLSGQPLDQFCAREIFQPLGMDSCRYLPAPEQRRHIPPTEKDRTFRHRLVQGEVNDENAHFLGGVAAHAGCFACAQDIARFAECMLAGGALPNQQQKLLFQPHTVELFTRREPSPPGTSHALGWDTPSTPSSSGMYFSTRSFGHLGYTGTSLWIDPERQLSVTLLTNRTWPDRGSQAIKQLRPAFHDAVVEAIDAEVD